MPDWLDMILPMMFFVQMSRMSIVTLGSLAGEALSLSSGAPPFLACLRSHLIFFSLHQYIKAINLQDARFSQVQEDVSHGKPNRADPVSAYLHSLYTV